MYLFEAQILNMDTDISIVRTIEIDGQFFESERDCYTYAMGVAYDSLNGNEILEKLELIAC